MQNMSTGVCFDDGLSSCGKEGMLLLWEVQHGLHTVHVVAVINKTRPTIYTVHVYICTCTCTCTCTTWILSCLNWDSRKIFDEQLAFLMSNFSSYSSQSVGSNNPWGHYTGCTCTFPPSLPLPFTTAAPLWPPLPLSSQGVQHQCGHPAAQVGGQPPAGRAVCQGQYRRSPVVRGSHYAHFRVISGCTLPCTREHVLVYSHCVPALLWRCVVALHDMNWTCTCTCM